MTQDTNTEEILASWASFEAFNFKKRMVRVILNNWVKILLEC